MARTRETLIVAKTKVDLDRAFHAYGGGFVDVTDLIDRKHYTTHLSRSAVGTQMAKLMPKETHQRIGIVVPIRSGESDRDWEVRCWMHELISILTPSYQNSVAIKHTDTF